MVRYESYQAVGKGASAEEAQQAYDKDKGSLFERIGGEASLSGLEYEVRFTYVGDPDRSAPMTARESSPEGFEEALQSAREALGKEYVADEFVVRGRYELSEQQSEKAVPAQSPSASPHEYSVDRPTDVGSSPLFRGPRFQ